MANDVLLSLGSGSDAFVFSVQGAAFDSLRRVSGFRWAKVDRPGRLPVRQSMGAEDDSITLVGSIVTERSGYGHLSALRALMAKGEPVFLCDSAGSAHGQWCIESVEETQTLHHSDGLPRRQAFSVKLSVYVG